MDAVNVGNHHGFNDYFLLVPVGSKSALIFDMLKKNVYFGML